MAEISKASGLDLPPFFEAGWHRDIPEDEYHSSNGISSTTLKTYLNMAPNEALYAKMNPREPSPSMVIGSLLHVFVLEPDRADDCYAVQPDFNLRSKAGKESKAAFDKENAGKLIVTNDQLEQAKMMALSVEKNKDAQILLDGSINESSVYYWYQKPDSDDPRDYRTMCKVRPDILCTNGPVIADLKSCEDATETGFQKSIVNFFYHLSAAMYLDGVNSSKELLKETSNYHYQHFAFIAVSKRPAFCTVSKKSVYNSAVYNLAPEALQMGSMLYQTAMRRRHDAVAENHPGLPDGVRDIVLPSYANKIPAV